MKQFLSICTCLFACYFGSAQGRADSLFGRSEYFEAAIAFEQEAFEAGRSVDRTVPLLKKAYCYKALGEYQEALDITSRITRYDSDSLRKMVMYERILLAYLLEDYPLAQNELIKWDLRFEEDDLQVLPMKFLVQVSLGQIDEARALLNERHEDLQLTVSQAASLLPEKWKLKNTRKAYNLSLFLPGVGQMYAGHFFKGVVSGTVQAGLVAFTAYHLYHGYFFSGGMTGAALLYTFYLGGARYAGQLAERNNEAKKASLKGQFLEAIKK